MKAAVLLVYQNDEGDQSYNLPIVQSSITVPNHAPVLGMHLTLL